MRKANIIISILLLVFAGYYAHLTTLLPRRDLPNTLGAAFMPWLLTACLTFLSVLLLLRDIFFADRIKYSTVTTSIKEAMGIVSLITVFVVYIYAMHYFGYVMVTPVFLVMMLLLAGSRKWWEVLLFSIIVTLAVYFLFHRLFRVPLPPGEIIGLEL